MDPFGNIFISFQPYEKAYFLPIFFVFYLKRSSHAMKEMHF